MTIEMFVWMLGSMTVVAVVVVYLISGRERFGRTRETSDTEMREHVLSNRYFRSIKRGDFARPLARAYSQMDMTLIRSLFTARNIASQTLFEITNNMRTGVGICGYNDIWVVVLNSEYLRAKQTMQEYIKARSRTTVPGGSKLRNVFELLLFGWAANPSYTIPELLRLVDTDTGTRSRHRQVRPLVKSRRPWAVNNSY